MCMWGRQRIEIGEVLDRTVAEEGKGDVTHKGSLFCLLLTSSVHLSLSQIRDYSEKCN